MAGTSVQSDTAHDIIRKVSRIRSAQARYRLSVGQVRETRPSVTRALAVKREIKQVMEWVLDDPDSRSALSSLKEKHLSSRDNASELAAQLKDYAALARENLSRLAHEETFDASLIDEALEFVRLLPKVRRGRPPGGRESREALQERREATRELQDIVRNVRAAARFVFRGHPEIVRQATSPYERSRRATYRSRAAAEPPAATDDLT